MLIAEEFVLLCLRPNGRLARSGRHAAFASGVKGTLVAELLIDGHVRVGEDDLIFPTGASPGDPLLVRVLDQLASAAGEKLTGARLLALRSAGWKEIVERLVATSRIGERRFPPIPARWPVVDAPTHERVVAEIRAAATGSFHSTIERQPFCPWPATPRPWRWSHLSAVTGRSPGGGSRKPPMQYPA